MYSMLFREWYHRQKGNGKDIEDMFIFSYGARYSCTEAIQSIGYSDNFRKRVHAFKRQCNEIVLSLQNLDVADQKRIRQDEHKTVPDERVFEGRGKKGRTIC